MIHLEPVTPENWRCGLRVREDQHCFAADSAGLLARAYAYRAQRSEPLVIYADNTPVGMALYYDLDELHAYNLSQLPGPGLRDRGRQAASAKTEDRRKI